MLDIRSLLERFDVPALGVVHVGAHIGAEDPGYQAMGFVNRLFVEADPNTYLELTSNLKDSGAMCENIAISDNSGTATLHVTNSNQSSSLLELRGHREVYPNIQQVAAIEVPTITLDELLMRERYRHLRFNFLNIDIQGAEMLALAGATDALRMIDALNLEINFDELYAGAPHVSALDAFLRERQFTRVDTISAHRTWGDGFWVHDRLTKAR